MSAFNEEVGGSGVPGVGLGWLGIGIDRPGVCWYLKPSYLMMK